MGSVRERKAQPESIKLAWQSGSTGELASGTKPPPTPVPYFLQKTGPPAGGHVFKYMSPLVGVSHLNRSGGYGEVWQ